MKSILLSLTLLLAMAFDSSSKFSDMDGDVVSLNSLISA